MQDNTKKVELPKKGREFNIWVFLGSSVWVFLILLIVLRIFVYQQVSVVGASMEPNYRTGELLFVNQVGDNFRRGMVVAVYDNEKVAAEANYLTRFSPGTRFLLKRIVGLPGEEIEMIQDKVIIYNDDNPEGVILEESYLGSEVRKTQIQSDFYFPRTKITDDHYFLLGDNRSNSTDSRRKGAFADFSILGYETVRFWPVSEFKFFDGPEYEFREIDEITKSQLENAREKQSSVGRVSPKSNF